MSFLKAAICREPHSYQVPAEPKAGAYWSDDRYGHFRNLAARCSTPAMPGMWADPPMEAGGRLGGPDSEARSYCLNAHSERGAAMEKDFLVLKRAAASRQSGEWNDDDFDVLAAGIVVGRIFKSLAAPVGVQWIWALAFEDYANRGPTYGYAATRDDAIASFAKSWRRE